MVTENLGSGQNAIAEQRGSSQRIDWGEFGMLSGYGELHRTTMVCFNTTTCHATSIIPTILSAVAGS